MDDAAIEAQVATTRWDAGATYVEDRPSDTEAAHPSRIIPTEFKVLILPEKVEERTKGGIFIPDEKLERDQYAAMKGTLVAVSPLAFTYENWPEGERKPQVGDRVIFAKYAGATVKGADDVEYRLVNDKDVAAILV